MTEELRDHFNRDDADRLIVCDMNGTLFGATGTPKFLNEALLLALEEARLNGYRVQLHSNDPHGNQGTIELTCQKYFGDPAHFGEVASKNKYAGLSAYIAIDDDHSSHSTNAAYCLGPTDYASLGVLTAVLVGPSPAAAEFSPKP